MKKNRRILGVIYMIEVLSGDHWIRHPKQHDEPYKAHAVKFMLKANGAGDVRIVKITTEEIN